MEIKNTELANTVSSCKLISCCLQNALPRVQENPIDRSSMLEVSSVLKIETEVVTIPEKVQN
jgi:chitinase